LYSFFVNSTPFRQPYRSLQTYSHSGFDVVFPYAMGVFGIYLNEKFGPDLTMNIWRGCGRKGPDFLRAIDSALISHTSGEYNLNKAFQEFGVWMLFTGSRSEFAPDGMRFDEAEFYPEIPSDVQSHDEYPLVVTVNQQEPAPESNSNSYVFLNGLDRITGDCFRPMAFAGPATRAGVTPGITLIGIPTDRGAETQVLFSEYSNIIFDTTFVVEPIFADAVIEGILAEHPCHDTVTVDTLSPPGLVAGMTIRLIISGALPSINLPNPSSFRQAIFILTQTSSDWRDYAGLSGIAKYPFAYIVSEESDMQTDIDPIDGQTFLPNSYSLDQNYPNPFNGSAIIRYSLPKRTQVTLDIYNVLGQHVRALVNRVQSPGNHQVAWDARDEAGHNVASGLYFYRLRADQTTLSRSMLFIK
ncbi:MAG: T9SS type A sorting domain-containing protein, partial [candidate division Zixibacteria bacterium]|nr:T9SS type A sorting domain-containing protein [candidate division Zixibacteria bacterium]